MRDQQFLTLSQQIVKASSMNMNRLEQKGQQQLKEYAERVVRDAQTLTPFRSGRLRAGYRTQVSGRFPNMQVQISNPIPYFEFVEYGWKIPRAIAPKKTSIAGQYMLTKSLATHEPELDELTETFQDMLQQQLYSNISKYV